VSGRIGGPDVLHQGLRGPEARRDLGKKRRIDLIARHVGLKVALGELGELANHAGQRHALHAPLHTPLQRASGEDPHLDEGNFRKLQLCHGVFFAAAPRREHDMDLVVGRCDVDRLFDAGAPGRCRPGVNDACGSQDRDPAENPEAGIERFLCELLTARDADLHLDPVVREVRRGLRRYSLTDHAAWHWIDGRSADLQAEPAQRHDSHTRSTS
jgi:hypothetical protein